MTQKKDEQGDVLVVTIPEIDDDTGGLKNDRNVIGLSRFDQRKGLNEHDKTYIYECAFIQNAILADYTRSPVLQRRSALQACGDWRSMC